MSVSAPLLSCRSLPSTLAGWRKAAQAARMLICGLDHRRRDKRWLRGSQQPRTRPSCMVLIGGVEWSADEFRPCFTVSAVTAGRQVTAHRQTLALARAPHMWQCTLYGRAPAATASHLSVSTLRDMSDDASNRSTTK